MEMENSEDSLLGIIVFPDYLTGWALAILSS